MRQLHDQQDHQISPQLLPSNNVNNDIKPRFYIETLLVTVRLASKNCYQIRCTPTAHSFISFRQNNITLCRLEITLIQKITCNCKKTKDAKFRNSRGYQWSLNWQHENRIRRKRDPTSLDCIWLTYVHKY